MLPLTGRRGRGCRSGCRQTSMVPLALVLSPCPRGHLPPNLLPVPAASLTEAMASWNLSAQERSFMKASPGHCLCVCAHMCVCVCIHACLIADTHRAASLWTGMGSCPGCEGPGLSGAGLTSQRSQGTALGDLRGTQTLGGAVAGCLLQCRSWAGNGLGLRNLQFFIYVTEMRGQRHLLSVVISVGPPVLEW